MIGDSDDKINFAHELLLTNRQVANICKAFAKKSSTDTKLSKTQISKMIKSGGFLGRLFCPLLKTSKTIQNETKEKRGGFISMLLGTLGASLLGNILAGR